MIALSRNLVILKFVFNFLKRYKNASATILYVSSIFSLYLFYSIAIGHVHLMKTLSSGSLFDYAFMLLILSPIAFVHLSLICLNIKIWKVLKDDHKASIPFDIH